MEVEMTNIQGSVCVELDVSQDRRNVEDCAQIESAGAYIYDCADVIL